MAVPYTFGTATASIPLSNLDSNFATTITLGNTAIQLGNTVTTLNNMTLANVAVTSVSTAFPNNLLANSSVTLGNTTVALGGTATTLGNVTLTNATVSSLSTAITVAQGGTGLTSTPANGALDIGNGTGFTRTTLTAGSGISITNGAGSISIAASSSGTPTSIANGTSNVSIASSGGNVVVATNGSTAVTVDTSQNLAFNSGYGSVATAYGCRAWVNFNGTGTVAIRSSGNVTSITNNGTGDYTVNLTTAMPDINYSVSLSGSANYGVDRKCYPALFTNISSATEVAPTTTAFRVSFSDNSGSAGRNEKYICVAVFR